MVTTEGKRYWEQEEKGGFMATFSRSEVIELINTVANTTADCVIARLDSQASRVMVGREELAELTGLSVRTIDRMADGGSWVTNRITMEKVWRATDVKLNRITQGGRVLFDKEEALRMIGKR